ATAIASPSTFTSSGRLPRIESYFSRWASVGASVMSLTATNSMSLSCSAARRMLRPMRPKPLMPTRIAMSHPVRTVLVIAESQSTRPPAAAVKDGRGVRWRVPASYRRLRSLACAWLLMAASAASAEERLVLMGGGDRPPAALARFMEWAGGHRARILVVTWASSEPAQSYASIQEDFAPYRPERIELAPGAPLGSGAKSDLQRQLAWATGVFFGGGDQ